MAWSFIAPGYQWLQSRIHTHAFLVVYGLIQRGIIHMADTLQRTFPFLEIKSVYWFKFHWHLFQGSTSQSVITGLGNGFVLNKQQSFTSWTFDDLVFPCIHDDKTWMCKENSNCARPLTIIRQITNNCWKFSKIQLSAVITRSNIVRYYINHYSTEAEYQPDTGST